jgi:hypothetical protein
MHAPAPAPANEAVKPNAIPDAYRDRAAKYADAARQRELDRLGKAPRHQRNNTLNTCAFKLGQFLPHGLLDRSAIAKQLADLAHKIGLEEQEIGATIESGLRSGSKRPRKLPFGQQVGTQSRIHTPAPQRPKDNIAVFSNACCTFAFKSSNDLESSATTTSYL